MSEWAPLPRELSTTRLTLGPWLADDVDAYRAMVLDRDARFPSAPSQEPTRDQMLASIRRHQTTLAATGICLYVLRVAGAFAGYCGVIVGRSSIDEPEIGYEIPRAFRARGYATEAARAVVAATASTGRTRMWATVRDWNEASFRVLDKVGFTATGRTTVDDRGTVLWWTRAL